MDVEPQKEISPKVCVTLRNTTFKNNLFYSDSGCKWSNFSIFVFWGIKTIDTQNFEIYSFENEIREKLSNKVL
jgi:hypothetical protein